MPSSARWVDSPGRMGRRTAATGSLLPQGGLSSGMHPPLSSSQSPLSSVSLAVTSSASLVPAMLARTRSLRCSGSPHRAGRGGGPNAKTAPAPLHPKGLPRPLRGLGRSSFPHRAGRGGGPFWPCPKRECAAPGGREKGAKRAPVQWPSARDGGRRIGASADLARPSGTLDSSAISVTAVPWRRVPTSSGWSSHETASFFAAAALVGRGGPNQRL